MITLYSDWYYCAGCESRDCQDLGGCDHWCPLSYSGPHVDVKTFRSWEQLPIGTEITISVTAPD